MQHTISPRAQRFLLWWGIAMAIVFALSYGLLIKLLPLPPATWPVEQVAAFYRANSASIRTGATICSWTGAFGVPIAIVTAAQLSRLEHGWPIWSVTSLVGGVLMSMFLVFPPVIWGVAAFNPARAPEVTAGFHELANLTLTTTDQYYIFYMVPVAYLALKHGRDPDAPFPRWFAYLSITIAILFEAGALAFIPKTGAFAWNGLFVYWIPLTTYGLWLTALCTVLFRAIRRQPASHD